MTGTFISASLLNDYISCNFKAFYRIFAKREAAPSKYMSIGTIVHAAIEKFSSDEEKAVSFVYKQSVPGLYKKDYTTAEDCVRSYFDNFAKFMTEDDEIEKQFKTKLYDDVYLVGKFDRISRGIIYDWKTTTKVPSSLSSDPQFIVYHDAYKRIYGKPANAVFFASLSEGRLVPYEHSEFHHKELFEKVVPQLIKDIKNKVFFREGIFRKGVCYGCSYKVDCLKGAKDGSVDGGEFAP